MADYISREAVVVELNAEGYTKNMRVHKRILSIPAADVRPVVHGSWIVTDHGDYQLIECDQCHAQMWNHQSELPNYCYECGSDMRPEGRTKE